MIHETGSIVSALSSRGVEFLCRRRNVSWLTFWAGFKKGVLGIGSEGVYSFPYSQLASARLFLAALGYTLRDNTQDAPTPGAMNVMREA